MELKKITKKYGDTAVFDNFSHKFSDGKITAIIGESGVGKTTLLNIVAGISSHDGEVKKDDKISYLFQNDRLVPNLTVADNIKLVNNDAKVQDLLESVELKAAENLFPRELSAGMSRRVAILRALAYSAETLLMDEPFINLDYYLKYKMMDIIKKYHNDNKNTIIIVTHDIKEAVYIADEIVVLKHNKVVKHYMDINKNTEEDILKILLKK